MDLPDPLGLEVWMAKVCGVIAEYDPLHNGHALHLGRAREASGADVIVVLMSGYVTQRGRFALFDPADRAEMALECGADIVYSVPWGISLRDAEHYALGMIALFARMGCVDALSFGSECADAAVLDRIAVALESEETQEALGGFIRSGLSYPRAVEKVLSLEGLAEPGFMARPNVILAVSYIRALYRLHSSIRYYPVLRQGDYHSAALSPAAPSATAVRGAFLRDEWDAVRTGVPDAVYERLLAVRREGAFLKEDREDLLLFSALLGASAADLGGMEGAAEGIENRILREMPRCNTRDQLTERTCTTHFTRARINRILTRFLLGRGAVSPAEKDFLVLRGFRKEASPLVGAISERIRCFQDFVSLERDEASRGEAACAKLWNLCAGRPASVLYTRGVTVKGR